MPWPRLPGRTSPLPLPPPKPFAVVAENAPDAPPAGSAIPFQVVDADGNPIDPALLPQPSPDDGAMIETDPALVQPVAMAATDPTAVVPLSAPAPTSR